MTWVVNDGIFRLYREPIGGHAVTPSGLQVLSKAELSRPACAACFRTMPDRRHDYCESCRGSGAGERHRVAREAGW